ncbi:MAG: AbrB/MazE/SpoVT family DNA-binding domain-containing protein [Candidatus Lokiarchaeota archaeon]|nr:AbrB/MazE/SpoVT family DNA-binding domain-containing protein [Candidatus Lokiarchaeota archaeon]
MKDIKTKYKRSIIKLGNSKAITFPQEWTESAKLKEKSEITLYPIDSKTLIIHAKDENVQKKVYRLDSTIIPLRLIRQAILSAFKLNVDEIYLKYTSENQETLYQLLIELRREIIGFDFKNLPESNEFFINFLLDTSKTTFYDVLEDLVKVFNTIIKNIVDGEVNKISTLLLDEIDRKYSLGTRILITGLSEYHFSRTQLPIIRFLGNRVILLYIRDFINEALMNLQSVPFDVIKKYQHILLKIPETLRFILKNYNNINSDTISAFQNALLELQKELDNTDFDSEQTKCNVRNSIKYYINSLNNFFDIGITRMIQDEIGIS